MLNWITSCLGSYTLTLNSTNLSGDMFLNFVVMSVVGDIPALFILMLTMKYFGRRFNLLYTQVVTGICCLILAFISKKVRWCFKNENTYLYYLFSAQYCRTLLEFWFFSWFSYFVSLLFFSPTTPQINYKLKFILS